MIRACRKPRRITRRDMPLCADHDAATWLKAFDRASCLASSPPPRTVAASLHWCAASCREPRPCMGVGQRRGRGHSQLPRGRPSIWSLSYRTPASAMPALCLTAATVSDSTLRTRSIQSNCQDRRSIGHCFLSLRRMCTAANSGRAGFFARNV